MKEYLLFFKEKSIWLAAIVMIALELLLQTGIYKPLLKKNSYASNVNRITDHPIYKKQQIEPNVLIVGTSIAYEGISLQRLNEQLQPIGLVAQTVAIPGADLMVQDLAIRKNLEQFPKVKYVIHVNEIQMPWVNQKVPSDAALSMISEFNRFDAIQKLKEDGYQTGISEISFVLFRLIGYRKDLGDLFLSLDKRLKDMGKAKKEREANLFVYENQYLPSMSLYPFKSLEECIQITGFGSAIPVGSDEYHRDAIHRTCKLAKDTILPLEKNETTQLYATRLSNMYKNIRSKNIQIINVFPPLPTYLDTEDAKKRIEFWKTEYKDIMSDSILNLYESIPIDGNSDYYYDMIHLNRKGMLLFTETLAKELIQSEFIRKENP